MSRLILDCDGVLADFVGHMIAELRVRGLTVPDEVDDYDFLRGFGEEVGAVARDLLKDPSHWLHIPPYEGARAFVDEIRAEGHDVVVATAPWLSCDAWGTARRVWLDRHFGFKHGDIFVCSKKEVLRGDAFIDDRAETVEKWADANDEGCAYLMLRSYTAKHLWPKFSWERNDVTRLLDALDRRRA